MNGSLDPVSGMEMGFFILEIPSCGYYRRLGTTRNANRW